MAAIKFFGHCSFLLYVATSYVGIHIGESYYIHLNTFLYLKCTAYICSPRRINFCLVKSEAILLPIISLQLSRTPLHIATDDRHFETIQLLLERGANVNAKDMVSIPTFLYICENVLILHVLN